MKKIMLVFGTRPEAIKMCPVVKELKRHAEFDVSVCVSGQHREMLKQVLDVFGVIPKYNLDIMKSNQTLFDITEKVMIGMRDIYATAKPDVVLVHGDTTTSFAAALAAFYMEIPVGHVEAGLRTYNIRSPYPEEFNRQAVDAVCDYYFAPTEISKQNLINEGKMPQKIFVTGNTAIDALATTVRDDYTHPELDWAKGSRLVLLTAHRRENLGEPMREFLTGIRDVLEEFSDVKVIYPVHLNPAVKSVADEILNNFDRVHLLEPLDVLDFHNFIKRSHIILTDSGGIQEEAPSLGKPVLVLRDTTERPEGISAGTLKLVGTKRDDVYTEFKRLLTDKDEYNAMSLASNPYGDGHASERIARVLLGEKEYY